MEYTSDDTTDDRTYDAGSASSRIGCGWSGSCNCGLDDGCDLNHCRKRLAIRGSAVMLMISEKSQVKIRRGGLHRGGLHDGGSGGGDHRRGGRRWRY